MFLMLKHAQKEVFKDPFEFFGSQQISSETMEQINVDIDQLYGDFVELGYAELLYAVLSIPRK